MPVDTVKHPLHHGQTIQSLGCHFTYRVIGPCCQLFDREELPWPSCRLQWRGKEPSWRRVGRRFVPDMSAQRSPSYAVEIVGQEATSEPFILTLYWVKLPKPLQVWWYSRRPLSTGWPALEDSAPVALGAEGTVLREKDTLASEAIALQT